MRTENQNKFATDLFKKAVQGYPTDVIETLLHLKGIIFEQAGLNKKIGDIEESLKWGQLSYVSKNRSGTPIRLGIEKKAPNSLGLYVHCSTTVIGDVKHIYGNKFRYDGNRALLFDYTKTIPEKEIRHVIDMILSYHTNKRSF